VKNKNVIAFLRSTVAVDGRTFFMKTVSHNFKITE